MSNMTSPSARGPLTGVKVLDLSAYIAGPYGVRYIGPLTLVAWRFGIAAVVASGLALALRRRPGMDRRTVGRIALVGFVMNGFLFGAMYLAFRAGLSGTLGSLMHSLSPVLTALFAAVLLGERLTRAQVVGFVVGVVGGGRRNRRSGGRCGSRPARLRRRQQVEPAHLLQHHGRDADSLCRRSVRQVLP